MAKSPSVSMASAWSSCDWEIIPIKAYEKLVAQSPDSAWARYSLGVAELRHGDKDAGNADMATAQARDPHVGMRAAKFGLTVAGP